MSKLNSTLWAVALICICVLSFLLWQGCKKNKGQLQQITSLKNEQQIANKNLEAWKAASNESRRKWEDSMSVALGLLALKDNQIESSRNQLNAASNKIDQLIRDRTHIEPSDSLITTVPNEYIQDCEGCWMQLDAQNKLVNDYMAQISEKDSFSDRVSEIYNKRIEAMDAEKKNLEGLVSDYKEIAKAATKKAEPRRTVYLTLSVMGKESSLIMGAGAGFMYQDKRRRMFGLTAYGTNQGEIITGNLMLPLSFLRK